MGIMKEFEKVIAFIPVLDMAGLGQWKADERHAVSYSMDAPVVEYWDVVYRFADAVIDLADAHEELLQHSEAGDILKKLVRLIRMEEDCPGILLGGLESGIVLDWLKKLRIIGRENGWIKADE